MFWSLQPLIAQIYLPPIVFNLKPSFIRCFLCSSLGHFISKSRQLCRILTVKAQDCCSRMDIMAIIDRFLKLSGWMWGLQRSLDFDGAHWFPFSKTWSSVIEELKASFAGFDIRWASSFAVILEGSLSCNSDSDFGLRLSAFAVVAVGNSRFLAFPQLSNSFVTNNGNCT